MCIDGGFVKPVSIREAFFMLRADSGSIFIKGTNPSIARLMQWYLSFFNGIVDGIVNGSILLEKKLKLIEQLQKDLVVISKELFASGMYISEKDRFMQWERCI